MTPAADHVAAAQRWLAEDPDPATRAELEGLLDAGDEAALADRFGATLQFGTAGLRGALGAGPNRMNRATVRRVTAGLAAYLQDAGPGPVVVGRDARHGSAAFAEDACRVLAGAGLPVLTFPGPVPTPLVAYGVRALDAAAGVVVTASHNPASDNGYKVYGRGGAQIVSPTDAAIAAAIAAVESLDEVPLAPPDDPLISAVPDDLVESYLAAAAALAGDAPRDLRIVYTPLHGVAGTMMGLALVTAGYFDVHVVASQAEPDPDFPTVAFPNPEEPGALDAALALAEEVDADLVIANDPDGDRVALAVRGPAGWRTLSGDETGCLLADALLAQAPPGPRSAVATTVVSSRLLSRIAAERGATCGVTLTGFKWIAREAEAADRRGERFVLGYEQALGVSAGDIVRDKDGMSAGVLAAAVAATAKAGGRSLEGLLDDLARVHGAHLTAGRNLRLAAGDDTLVTRTLTALLSAPPADVAGVPVVAIADHRAGVRRLADGTLQHIPLPPTDLVVLDLADASWLAVRPSGTEPLLKLYAEVVQPVASTVEDARTVGRARLATLLDAFAALLPAT